MKVGIQQHTTTRQPGNSTPPNEPLAFGRRSSATVRLALLGGLGAFYWMICCLDGTQGWTPGLGAVILMFVALLIIFGQETQWSYADDQIIIETSSLVVASKEVIAGAAVASLHIKTVKDSDGPDTFDIELRTRLGSLHKLNHRRWDRADAMLTQLSTVLRR
jgi:hypothetical protein